jgi:beta-galactosidase
MSTTSPSNVRLPGASRVHLGAAYYPEHWPEDRWTKDIQLMREAGLTVVRLAEFAWSTLEPAEGEFHLDWLDRAISAFASADIASVLGTPTAAPPAWLVQRHPDLLAVDESDRRVQFGNRCHYCVNSPEMHAATRRIVGAMAERFGSNPHVIGWQIDNEYNRVCTCDRCQSLFQRYLAVKFGSLQALNDHWSTAYWSQTYSAWEQIPLPVGPHNPGLMLEFKRFVTASYRQFQRLQMDVLRPHLRKEVWTTHNFMGWFDGLDHYEMTQDLDLAAWDWYVGTGHHDYLTTGAAHDLTRGFKRRNYWLMETQPGHVNWSSINTTLNRGEARAMAWHAVAHGADAVLYWQWRSALGGQEQFHGTLVDQSGQPRPFYREVQQLGRDLASVPFLAGSTLSSEVALLNSYDSRWSIQWQRHHRDFDYVEHLLHYYRPLAARNIAADIISADAPLDGYKLVIAPALTILNQSHVVRLQDFVARGGHLVLTLRTGMKDDDNALLPSRQPGPLADLAGVQVEEYYALLDPVPVSGEWFDGSSRLWAERLQVRGGAKTRIIARYGASNGWLDGYPAITAREHGEGEVKKIVCIEDEPDMANLIKLILERKGYDLTIAIGGQAGLEAIHRVKPDLVLLDLMMPDMDGWQVYGRMKADEEMKGIPVIIVTARAQSADRGLGLHIAKVKDFIVKPFSPQELLQSLERINGRVYCVGAYLDDASQQSLLNHIAEAAGVQPVLETPPGVEARKRVTANGQEVLILINHERAEKPVGLPWPAREHLTNQSIIEGLKLMPYDVAVLTRFA